MNMNNPGGDENRMLVATPKLVSLTSPLLTYSSLST